MHHPSIKKSLTDYTQTGIFLIDTKSQSKTNEYVKEYTKFCDISTVYLPYLVPEISQNFMAF